MNTNIKNEIYNEIIKKIETNQIKPETLSKLHKRLTRISIHTVYEILNQINQYKTEQEYKLARLKHTYKQNIIQTKYSIEYEIYKTIKEKEERSKIENSPLQEIINETEYQISTTNNIIQTIENIIQLEFYTIFDEDTTKEA